MTDILFRPRHRPALRVRPAFRVRPALRVSPAFRVRLTALVVAAGVAVVAVAPPARAQVANENIAGWIAGAVALGLIAKAIEDDRQRDRDRRRAAAQVAAPPAAPVPPVHTPVVPEHVRDPRPLPSACLTTYRVGSALVDYLPEACLDRTYRDADLLPASCRQTIRTAEGNAAVYVPGCLTDRGFRIERADWRHDRPGRGHWDDDQRSPWDIPGQHWR